MKRGALTNRRRLISLMMILWLVSAADLGADGEWEAKYWNNVDMSGSPALERQESEVDHDWGDGSPANGVNRDQFSARWERDVKFSEGAYRFIATTDDGMRVWVGDSLVIDSWYDSQEHVVSNDIWLAGGRHRVKVEYYEQGGEAVAKINWMALPAEPGVYFNWRGEYFNNTSLLGPPVLVRDDRAVDFDWGAGSPSGGRVTADGFSARWTRDVFLNAGRYVFLVTADDGFRLWVNDTLLMDEWQDQGPAVHEAKINLPGGFIPIKMEYYENRGGATAQLSWSAVDAPVTVDKWLGEYYDNLGFVEPAALVREDEQIDFNWGLGSPSPAIANPDFFTVRWTRTVNLPAGRYRFTVTSDDGFRLWVDDELLMHAWDTHATQTYSQEVELAGGDTTVKLEYFENQELAEVHLAWTPVGAAPLSTQGVMPGAMTATVIRARYLNVRSGPGFQYDPFDFLTGGQVVELTGFRDYFANWIQVYLPDGRVGWVGASYLASETPFIDLQIKALPVR